MGCSRTQPTPPTFEPPLERWPDAGVYQLRLRVSVELRVRVGRLGRLAFPAGFYVYTGRAARGLPARVRRHVRGSPRQHWHIDYLLRRPEVQIERVVLASDDPADECAVNQTTIGGGSLVIPGFGASDCRHGCSSHLRFCGRASAT